MQIIWGSVLLVFGFLSFVSSSAVAAGPERITFKNANGETIKAVYFKSSATPAAPGPAVIMLHGCSGLYTKSGNIRSRERQWIEILGREGYAILLPDSFGSRGHGSLCKIKDRPVKPERERPLDAAAALKWLSRQSGIDPTRIALMGWSNGAMTSLHTIRSGAAVAPASGAPDFKTAVIFYPGCIALNKAHADYKPRMKTLIQHGELDDWTLAKPCEDLVRRTAPIMEIDVYPDAYHSFDHPTSKVREITTRHSGYKTGERTVHVGSNPEAREKAIARTLAWLREYLRK